LTKVAQERPTNGKRNQRILESLTLFDIPFPWPCFLLSNLWLISEKHSGYLTEHNGNITAARVSMIHSLLYFMFAVSLPRRLALSHRISFKANLTLAAVPALLTDSILMVVLFVISEAKQL